MTDTVMQHVPTGTAPHYAPLGWEQWPEDPWMSFQFRRALGQTQVGGGTVSECFQAASRIVPGDRESWYREWRRLGERAAAAGDAAAAAGHGATARATHLRAMSSFRSAEFWLAPDDPRKSDTFDRVEACFRAAARWFIPAAEHVEIPYEGGVALPAHFLRSRVGGARQPVLVAFGGLDSYKEELYLMLGQAVLARGLSCLLVDGPGQGATLRRLGLPTRPDYEVPVARCLDWLEQRDDVDSARIAVSGTSIGGYYAARAAAFEPRLAAAVSHGGSWDLHEVFGRADESHPMAHHIRAVFGLGSMDEVGDATRPFRLEGVLGRIRCPYLIIHGGEAVFGTAMAETAYEHARQAGVDVELRLIGAEETGADHCQHDNPTVACERVGDWLADRLGGTERAANGP